MRHRTQSVPLRALDRPPWRGTGSLLKATMPDPQASCGSQISMRHDPTTRPPSNQASGGYCCCDAWVQCAWVLKAENGRTKQSSPCPKIVVCTIDTVAQRAQMHGCTKVQRHIGTEILRCRGTCRKRHRSTEVQKYRGTKVQKHRGKRRYTGPQSCMEREGGATETHMWLPAMLKTHSISACLFATTSFLFSCNVRK